MNSVNKGCIRQVVDDSEGVGGLPGGLSLSRRSLKHYNGPKHVCDPSRLIQDIWGYSSNKVKGQSLYFDMATLNLHNNGRLCHNHNVIVNYFIFLCICKKSFINIFIPKIFPKKLIGEPTLANMGRNIYE